MGCPDYANRSAILHAVSGGMLRLPCFASSTPDVRIGNSISGAPR